MTSCLGRWIAGAAVLSFPLSLSHAQCSYVETAQFFGPKDGFYAGALGIENDVAVVGAPWTDVGGEMDQGAAYVYRRIDGKWVFDVELTAADGSYLDMFGDDVAVANGRLVISNSGWDKPGAGGVYIYELSQAGRWVQTGKVDCPPEEYWFANAISAEGDLLAVQAGEETGSVHLYRYSDAGPWQEEARLTMPGDDGLNYFGVSLSISGDAIAVGMANWYEPVEGRAFVFARGKDGQWTEQAEIVPPPIDAGPCFATSVLLSGSHLFLGASYGDGGPFAAYRWYAYERDVHGDWDLLGPLPGPMTALSGELAILSADLYQHRADGNWHYALSLPGYGATALAGSRVILGDRYGDPDPTVYMLDLIDCEPCPADLNEDGVADLFDFLAFVNLFNANDPAADCDQSGEHDLFDFECFLSVFNQGC